MKNLNIATFNVAVEKGNDKIEFPWRQWEIFGKAILDPIRD